MAITKVFQDAIPKTENRHYQQVNNADGTISLVDVTEYEQEGTYLNAETLNGYTNELNEAMETHTEEMNEAIARVTTTEVAKTLLASGWSNKTYNLTVSGVTTTSIQELLPSLTITQTQLEALQGANIIDGGQSANTIVLKAMGDIPKIDIPIRVLLRGVA